MSTTRFSDGNKVVSLIQILRRFYFNVVAIRAEALSSRNEEYEKTLMCVSGRRHLNKSCVVQTNVNKCCATKSKIPCGKRVSNCSILIKKIFSKVSGR